MRARCACQNSKHEINQFTWLMRGETLLFLIYSATVYSALHLSICQLNFHRPQYNFSKCQIFSDAALMEWERGRNKKSATTTRWARPLIMTFFFFNRARNYQPVLSQPSLFRNCQHVNLTITEQHKGRFLINNGKCGLCRNFALMQIMQGETKLCRCTLWGTKAIRLLKVRIAASSLVFRRWTPKKRAN